MDKKVVYTISANDLLSAQLAGINVKATEVDGTMAGLNKTIGNVGAALGIAFGIGQVKSFVGAVISAGTTVENATTGLTTLLGDSAQAAQVVQNTMIDATKTPFAFEGLLAANKALIAAGVGATQARTDVTNLANAIAATGGGDDELQRMVINMQQIRNTGKATAADIKQFAFAGVNIYKILADATDQPISKVKDMEVSYDMLTFALQKAHEKGGAYFNGLENMAGNTSVQISNLGDGLFKFMNQIFVDFKPLIDATISALGALTQGMVDSYEWAKKNTGVFKMLGIALIAGAVAWGVMNAATVMGIVSMGAASVSAGILTATLFILENVLTFGIPLAIAAVAGALYYAYENFAKFNAVINGTWESLKVVGGMIGQLFTGIWDKIAGVFTADKDRIARGSMEMATAFKDGGKRVGDAFNSGYDESMVEFAKKNQAAPEAKKKTANGVAAASTMPALTTKATKEKHAASGSGRPVTINITIGSLIHDFKISTQNIQESSKAIHDKVVTALTAAVNDSQLIAGN